MKTLKKLLLVLLICAPFVSCEKEDLSDDCGCVKTVERFESYYEIINTLPITRIRWVVLSEEVVPCQEEQYRTELGDQIFFTIECE